MFDSIRVHRQQKLRIDFFYYYRLNFNFPVHMYVFAEKKEIKLIKISCDCC